MKHNILDLTLTDEQFGALSNRTRRDILALLFEESMDPRQIARRQDPIVANVCRRDS